jgi:hypothetical protein
MPANRFLVEPFTGFLKPLRNIVPVVVHQQRTDVWAVFCSEDATLHGTAWPGNKAFSCLHIRSMELSICIRWEARDGIARAR